MEGVYMLDTQRGKVPVTFRRNVLDSCAPEVRMLTYDTDGVERSPGCGGGRNG
jgi:hypothetical protein